MYLGSNLRSNTRLLDRDMVIGKNDRALLRAPSVIDFPVLVARTAERIDFALKLLHECLHGGRV